MCILSGSILNVIVYMTLESKSAYMGGTTGACLWIVIKPFRLLRNRSMIDMMLNLTTWTGFLMSRIHQMNDGMREGRLNSMFQYTPEESWEWWKHDQSC